MNTIKQILARQEWIGEVKKRKVAVAAIMAYAAMYVPWRVKWEIGIKAATSGVSFFDVLCCNLAYEIAMISCSLDEGVNSEFWKSLAGIKASRVGCTSFGIYEKIDGIWDGCRIAPGVMHARNLDWPDPEGLLAKHTEVVKRPSRLPRLGWLDQRDPTHKHYYSVTFPGYSGILTGLAPGRFSVALNAVWNDDGLALGDAPTLLLREALETCPDYYSAIKLLSQRRLVCGAMFTVVNGGAFPQGTPAVVIERTTGKFAIRKPVEVSEDRFVVCATNAFQILGKEPVKGASEIGSTSCNRHATVMEEAVKLPKDFDEDDVRRVLDKVRLSCTIYSTVLTPEFDEVDVRR